MVTSGNPNHSRWPGLVVIQRHGRTMIVQEEFPVLGRLDCTEFQGCLAEVEAVGEVIRIRVGIRVIPRPHRPQSPILFNKLQNTPEVMVYMGDIFGFHIR